MRKEFWLGVIIVWISPAAAFAQDAAVLQLPGSLSASIGTLTPSERGNVVSSVTMEQGFTPFRKGSLFVVGFASSTVSADTLGLPWNRAKRSTTGFKLVSVTRVGVIQAVAGVMAHHGGDGIRVSRAAYVSYWTAWRGEAAARSAAFPNALPGHAWASSGLVTAAEPNNWITSVSVQQGATLFRYRGASVTPFVGARGGADNAGYNWNNRVHAEAGLKISREVLSGVLEIGMTQRTEFNRLTHESHAGPVVFANLWIGWSPAMRIAR